MRIEAYPPQEPLSEAGQKYGNECLRRGEGLSGEESSYGADPYQGLIVFRPARPSGAVFVFFHGGGWTSGYKEWMSFMAPAFTARGVTFVTAGYRLAPAHVFPVGFEDCVRAVQWVRDHIGGKLFVGGHSAGGHYAALLALEHRDLVRGALPLSGVYDFTGSSGLTVRPRFLGASGSERAASPRFNLVPPFVPFYIAHGSEDFPHLMRQAEVFETELRAAGGVIERDVLPGRNHFTANYAGGEPDGPWVPRALEFIQRYS